MMKKQLLFLALLVLGWLAPKAQPVNLPLQRDALSRYAPLIYSSPNFHTAVRPYLKSQLKGVESIDSALCLRETRFPLLFNQNLYEKHFSNGTNLIINPVFSALTAFDTGESYLTKHLDAGLSLESSLNEKWTFHADLFYSAFDLPLYATAKADSSQIVPHLGKSSYQNGNWHGIFPWAGYVSYSPNKHFNLQAGRGKHFFGDGYRSLQLSDNANLYPYFKFSIDVWQLKYVSLFTQLKDIDVLNNNLDLGEKFGVMHFLSLNLGERLNINLFETVVWNARDSVGYRGFDLQYLNPVIFYRPVEFSLGSPDNVLLGVGFRLKLWQNFHIYGQGILDEMSFSELTKGDNYWGNKYGFQFGFKSFNPFGVKNLYLQAEYNQVRPYTYSHHNSLQNYGHSFQALAHPLGANFREAVFILRYQPATRWQAQTKTIVAKYGADYQGDLASYGHNIYLPYSMPPRVSEYGNHLGQGNATTLLFNESKVVFLLNPRMNLQLEAGVVARRQKNEHQTTQTLMFLAGIRTNLYQFSLDF